MPTELGLHHGETIAGNQILKPGTSKKHHREWLKLRAQGIGASDISTILGLNRFHTPLQLWLERTGQIDPPAETLRMELGKRFEKDIADLFAKETGHELYPLGLWQSKARPYHTATPDFGIVGHNALVECKLTGVTMAKEWSENQTSDHAELQAQGQMYVTGADMVYVAALVMSYTWSLEIRKIHRDDKVIAHILRAGEDFMEHVRTGTPPPSIDVDNVSTIDTAHPLLEGVRRELIGEARSAWFRHETAKESMKNAEKVAKESWKQVKEFLAGAEIPTIEGSPLGKFVEISRDGYYVNPTTYIKFQSLRRHQNG